MFSSHELRENRTLRVGDHVDSKKRPNQKAVKPLTIEYGAKKPLPGWVSEIINTSLAIEAEDAKSAGHLGFMARALVIATMPYKDPKADVFKRVNGDFKLRIVAGYEGGVPFGIYPRLLMSWVATEAVRKQSPVIELGDSLRVFLRDVLELRSNGGGSRGTSTRVNDQMKRLFGALVTAQYSGPNKNEGFVLRNVMIADELEIAEDIDLDDDAIEVNADTLLWMPQRSTEAGKWKSQVRLNNKFFNECINNPVPIDLRAYKVLRGSPLAMDVYTWLTYRMSCMQRRSRPIRWESLMGQFGSNFGSDIDQAIRDFRKAFFKALKLVNIVYPQAKIEVHEHGLVLLPSPPHIPFKTQPTLF
ncbi:MAG: replication protein RepA [Burkholderiaceae bacterium]